MPTCARKHYLHNSLIYHVYNRCSITGAIFHAEKDFLHFVRLLRRYREDFLLSIYHWVIMTTHFHLLLEIEEPARISKFMAGIAHAYTIYHHRNYLTRGFLWQGRFKLQPIQKEQYLFACGRYIERNPVRAGIVNEAGEYPWSSARFYCSGLHDGLTSKDPTLERFGPSDAQRRSAYTMHLRDFKAGEEELFHKLEEPVGDDSFRNLLRRTNGRLMPQRRGRPSRIFIPHQTECHYVS